MGNIRDIFIYPAIFIKVTFYSMVDNYTLLPHERKVLANLNRYKHCILILPSVTATFILLIMNIDFEVNFQTYNIRFSWTQNDYKFIDINGTEYFIKGQGCTIPGFEPFNQAILKFIYKEKIVRCYNETNPPLVESDHSSIWIEKKYFPYYNITNEYELVCFYTSFYRQPSSEIPNDNRFKFINESFIFSKRTVVKYQFIKVECIHKQQLIYKDFHSFVIKESNTNTNPSNKFNVLVLGIDAVSRLNFHRTMPQTLKYLEESDVIEFKGYNKVGDNTFPNLIPVLSGLSGDELSATCYLGYNPSFDEYPFIWKKYSEAGYYTAFAEDAAPIGLFNYLKAGFIEKPTDYYWRTFAYLSDKEIGHEKHLNANLCLGPRLSVDVLLSYVKKFVKTMSTSPYFGFFWETSITHDYLNYPPLCDELYLDLIKSLIEKGWMKKTILVLMSDHGIRWGDIRSTHQGYMEERLPFLFFVLPKHFQQKYPLATYNMKRNTRRLTTPFDLHETLLDLLHVHELTNYQIKNRYKKRRLMESRGISLFFPLDEKRTCQMAAIEPHWCTCHRIRKLNLNNTLPSTLSNVVAKHINDLLANYVQCAKLNVTNIIDLMVGEPSYTMNSKDVNHIVLDYTIIVQTKPGGGLFEATVRNTTVGWQITGLVSRINLYGQQSSCIDDFRLKLYCYCDYIKH